MIKKSCYRGWHATSNSPAAAELPVPPCPAGAHYALFVWQGMLRSVVLLQLKTYWLPCIAVAEDYLKNLSFLTMFTVLYVQETSFWTWTLKDNCSNALPMRFTHNACAVHCTSNANSQQLYTSSLYNASDSGLSVMWLWCHKIQGDGRDKNYMYLHLTVLQWSLLNLAGIPSQINLNSQHKASWHQSSYPTENASLTALIESNTDSIYTTLFWPYPSIFCGNVGNKKKKKRSPRNRFYLKRHRNSVHS